MHGLCSGHILGSGYFLVIYKAKLMELLEVEEKIQISTIECVAPN